MLIPTPNVRFFALEYSETVQTLPQAFILTSGKEWAKRSESCILAELDKIAIDNLSAAVLLHDYALRMGNFAKAFMLSSITTRMAQALQINLEHSTDILCQDSRSLLSASAKEARRRLMWTCYIIDALVGSGVDQLTFIDEEDVKIQLPCSESNFILQKPCITETLEVGKLLKFLEPEATLTNPADNMDMMASLIRHIEIRKRVLKYIKNLGTAKLPWLPDSEFAELDAECRNWYETLPDTLKFNPTAIYIRKEMSQLSSLCVLHYAYHQTMCDLYRIGAPALYKLRARFRFPPEQSDFLHHLQRTLYEHAKSHAVITAEGLKHGVRILADSWVPSIVYDSSRIMLYFAMHLVNPATEDGTKKDEISFRDRGTSVVRSQCATAEAMLEKVCVNSEILERSIIPDDPYMPNPNDMDRPSFPGTPAQTSPDYVLNPLSIYRMARKEIPEKHAPEKTSSPSTSSLQQSQHTGHQQLRVTDGFATFPADLTVDLSADEQASLDELQEFFTTDLGWTWQPAETAVESSTEVGGVDPPWFTSLFKQ
ncbi:hypothetical protein AYO22_00841 [Fonsecaea multimorphosa]|nr:hypothetical protein AYO22_00841 [Fonsecaea multimorphosa]